MTGENVSDVKMPFINSRRLGPNPIGGIHNATVAININKELTSAVNFSDMGNYVLYCHSVYKNHRVLAVPLETYNICTSWGLEINSMNPGY